jgi:non-specific serine/threonine protein kinase/serine/threonine-protein kinase
MQTPSWEDVRRELGTLLDLPAGLRGERLASLPPALRAEVESLLRAHEAPAPLLDLPEERTHPDTIGAYRVIGEIGRGGMGVVLRAERADGEMVRQVAIKLAGGRMFAPEAERRFIRERQILATLDHPHIVRLLDGGVTNGQRYFVMELVEGTPITEYARGKPLNERVRLMIDVCAAMHYAHQRMVLHRDLKPGNIIVSRDGQVKILDFGIAQILHGDVTGGPAQSTMIHPLSIACASPEQLRGEPLSLASDIYSLGVLLSELVTGTNPRYQDGAGFDQNLRRALDDELPPPSRVVSSLPRDLDAIVLKALARRPEDRYASVAALQADLQCLLEGRPVQAIPPRAGYLVRRFVARNKALSAAAVLLLAAVVTTAGIYIRQSRIEQRRFEDARQLVHTVVFDIQPQLEGIPATLPLRKTLIERTLVYLEAVSRDVGNNVVLLRELANSYARLAVIQGDALAANLGDRTVAAGHFTQAAALMDRALALAPDDAGVLSDASAVNRRRSDFALQGEDRAEALRLGQIAVDLAERSIAIDGVDEAAREARALAAFSLGRAQMAADAKVALGYFDTARTYFLERAKTGAMPLREPGLIELYTSDLLIKTRDTERAPHHAREALRLANEVLAARPNDQIAQLDVAVAAGQLASILYNTGAEDDAVEFFQMSADMREQMLAADPDNVRIRERVAMAKGRLGTILARAGDFPAAHTMLDRAVALYEGLQKSAQLAPTMEADFAEVLGHLADYHQRTSNQAAACVALRRAEAILRGAAARAPLSEFRRQSLTWVVEELERCP